MSLIKNMNNIKRKIKQEALEEMKESITLVANDSLEQCPLDTGDLRESFKATINDVDFLKGTKDGGATQITDIKATGTVLKSTSSYNTVYAAVQHEELDFNHPTPGTKAKYLEDALKNNEQEIVRAMQDKIREALR